MDSMIPGMMRTILIRFLTVWLLCLLFPAALCIADDDIEKGGVDAVPGLVRPVVPSIAESPALPEGKIPENKAYGLEDFIDALLDHAGGGAKGVKTYMECFNLLFKILDMEMDEEAILLTKKIKPLVEEYDFPALYKSPLLKDLPNDYRGVVLNGRPGVRSQQLGIADSNFDSTRLTSFGDFIFECGIKPTVSQKNAFLLNVNGKSRTQYFSYRSFSHFSHYLLRLYDPGNIESTDAPESPFFNYLTGPSRKLVNQITKTYPVSISVFERYMYMSDSLIKKYHEDAAYMNIATTFRLKMENVTRDSPNLGKYLESFAKCFGRTEIRVRDQKGHNILTLEVNRPDAFFSLNAYTVNGQVIPFTDAGIPILEDAFNPDTRRSYHYQIDVKTYFRIYGIVFLVDRARINWHYNVEPLKESIRFSFAIPPRIQVYDSGIFFMPKWFAKMIVPDAIINKINKTASFFHSGNNGQGTFVQLDWKSPEHNDLNTYWTISSEVPVNFYSKLGIKFLKSKALPDQETIEEMNATITRFLDLFVRDILPFVIQRVTSEE